MKFKRRKKMSVKKLEDERQNLLRVNDILAELEKQIGPLEKQSEVAKEYLKKKEELKTYDINMFLLESARLKEQIQEMEEKLSIAQNELDSTNEAYANTKTEYEQIERQVEEIDDSIESYKNKLNETNLLKQQLENQIELLKEQIHSVHLSDEHYEQRVLTIEKEVQTRKEQLAQLHEETETVSEQLTKKAAAEAQTKETLIAIQTRIASLTNQIEE